MVKLTVLYGPPTDEAAFEDHYLGTHLPLVSKMSGVQRFEASRVVATTDGGNPPYYRIAELWFNDQDELQQAMASEEGQATAGDIPNFATGGATILISDVD